MGVFSAWYLLFFPIPLPGPLISTDYNTPGPLMWLKALMPQLETIVHLLGYHYGVPIMKAHTLDVFIVLSSWR